MRRPTRLLATAAVLMLVVGCTANAGPAPATPGASSDARRFLAAAPPAAQGTVLPTRVLAPHQSQPFVSTTCDLMPAMEGMNHGSMECGAAYTPTPGPNTPTPVPPTLQPTATALPATAVPTGQPTPAPSEMIEGVPLCTDHNPTQWHPLVKRDAANTIVCTYGHEHHDTPTAVNDIFGPPSAWYGGSQEISYPWQTSSALGQENVLKHPGYKWYVGRDLPCLPVLPNLDPGCIVAYRVQVHTLGTAADAVVRFHSFGIEALVDYQGQRGIIRHGGHMDTGYLKLLVNQGNSFDPLCFAPGVLPNDAPYTTCGDGPNREHSSANVPAPNHEHAVYDNAWYATHQVSSVAPGQEEWGPIDYADPAHQLFFPADRPVRAPFSASSPPNNSHGVVGSTNFNLELPFLRNSTDRTTHILTFNGWTDQNGAATTGCSAPSPACVPLQVGGVRADSHYWMDGAKFKTSALYPQHEHDVLSPATGKSLIKFPN